MLKDHIRQRHIEPARAFAARLAASVAEPAERISTHWLPFLLLVIIPGFAMTGIPLAGFGVALLLRDDPWLFNTDRLAKAAAGTSYGWQVTKAFLSSSSLITHWFATFFAGMFWLVSALIGDREDARFMRLNFAGEARYILLRTLPVSLAFLLIFILFGHGKGAAPWDEIARCVAGALFGCLTIFCFTGASRWIARKIRLPRRYVLYVMLALLIVGVHVIELFLNLLAIASIYKLLATISGIYILALYFDGRWRLWVLLAMVGLPLVYGSFEKFKYVFPGMNYECWMVLAPARLGAVQDEPSPQRQCADGRKYDLSPVPMSSARNNQTRKTPRAALDEFSEALGDRSRGRRLIVVAASGGAYRATFWTAMVLDELMKLGKQPPYADLPQHIRLLTGASGGMVGAAYFSTLKSHEVALPVSLVTRIEDDIKQEQSRSGKFEVGLPRDSLSPVLQRLVMWDMLHLSWKFRSIEDRGVVLQSHWNQLAKPFGQLGQTAGGIRSPSIIFSPMIAETGQPLLISDLDLKGWDITSNRFGWEFFDVFPDTFDTFTLQTAARMSATFPMASPSVSLPTHPLRRVVDAGYFDNYGLTTALAYLRRDEVVAWMKDKGLKGALIIQINAFPVLAPPSNAPGPECVDTANQPGEGLQLIDWLATPLVGAGTARVRGMVYRGEQELRSLQARYTTEGLDLRRAAFENTARSIFSWYLPDQDMKCMESEMKSKHIEDAIKQVRASWTGK